MERLSRYRKALEKKFSKKPVPRKGFNFLCDIQLVNRIKIAAKMLECPIYPLMEEIIERGMSDVGVIMTNEILTERLQRHLLTEHLLVDHIDPETETESRQALRLRNAIEIVELYEERGWHPNEIRRLLDSIETDARKRDSKRS